MWKDGIVNKDNYDQLLNAFAKEYKKQYGKTPLEIVIVGGGSILINYGFREMTRDFDVVASNIGAIKNVAIAVANKYNLTDDWINEDFKFTASFSDKLYMVSKPYRRLNNGTISVRTVRAEYLIAMKMQADREYEHDVSDIIGIIKAEKHNGNQISYEKVEEAGKYLYGDKFEVSESLKDRVKLYTKMTEKQLEDEYNQSVIKSANIKEILIQEGTTNRERVKRRSVEIEQEMKLGQGKLDAKTINQLSKPHREIITEGIMKGYPKELLNQTAKMLYEIEQETPDKPIDDQATERNNNETKLEVNVEEPEIEEL